MIINISQYIYSYPDPIIHIHSRDYDIYVVCAVWTIKFA